VRFTDPKSCAPAAKLCLLGNPHAWFFLACASPASQPSFASCPRTSNFPFVRCSLELEVLLHAALRVSSLRSPVKQCTKWHHLSISFNLEDIARAMISIGAAVTSRRHRAACMTFLKDANCFHRGNHTQLLDLPLELHQAGSREIAPCAPEDDTGHRPTA